MSAFTVAKRRQFPTPPGAFPRSGELSVEIRLSVPAGATSDDVSRILTSALVEIAEDFGASVAPRELVSA